MDTMQSSVCVCGGGGGGGGGGELKERHDYLMF